MRVALASAAPNGVEVPFPSSARTISARGVEGISVTIAVSFAR